MFLKWLYVLINIAFLRSVRKQIAKIGCVERCWMCVIICWRRQRLELYRWISILALGRDSSKENQLTPRVLLYASSIPPTIVKFRYVLYVLFEMIRSIHSRYSSSVCITIRLNENNAETNRQKRMLNVRRGMSFHLVIHYRAFYVLIHVKLEKETTERKRKESKFLSNERFCCLIRIHDAKNRCVLCMRSMSREDILRKKTRWFK